MPFWVLIICEVFLTIGLITMKHYIWFLNRAAKIDGVVSAIEKYTNRFDGGDRNYSVFYRPIIAYKYESQPYSLTGLGRDISTMMQYYPGQAVTVLVAGFDKQGRPIAKLKDRGYLVFGGGFAVLGLIGFVIYGLTQGSLGSVLPIGLIIPLFITGLFSWAFPLGKLEGLFDRKPPSHNTASLITTMQQYRAEFGRFKNLAYGINILVFVLGIGLLYAAYHIASTSTLALQNQTLPTLWGRIVEKNLSQKELEFLILFGAGAAFSVFTALSLIKLSRLYAKRGF